MTIRIDRETLIQLTVGIAAIVLSILTPALLGSGYWTHNFLVVNLVVDLLYVALDPRIRLGGQ